MTFTYLNRALRNSPPPAHVMCRTPDYRLQWLRLRDAIQPGLTLGGLTVLAIVGEHVYLRQVFRTNTTRRWQPYKLSAFRHNRPRRWPYHLTPVRMPIESVLRIMRDEKGRWGSAICAPLTAIEARFIEQRGEWDWSGEGKIVCRWRESSKRGKERGS